jgi:hypothetical protein
VAIAVSAGSVSAAPSDREKARDKVAEGARMLGAHDFRNALARFDEAYSLYPSPKLHYNRGLALEGLGRRADAFVAFTRFVEEATDPSPDYLKHARRELERLKTLIGFLDVSTEPVGAEIRVDRLRIGVTPLSSPVPIEPGTHEVSAHAPDSGPDAVQQVTIGQGERLKVNIQVRPAPGITPPSAQSGLDPRSGSKPGTPMPIGHPGEPSQPQAGEGSSWKRPAAWSALAAGAGALGLGVYETMAFRNRRNDFESLSTTDPNGRQLTLCGATDPNRGQDPRCKTLYDRGQTALTISIVGYVSAAVLGGVSAYLFTTSEQPRASTAMAWTCGLGRLSASCRFSF